MASGRPHTWVTHGGRYSIMAVALGTATALVAGHMSDRIGGKKSLLAGCGLAAPTYVPSKHFDIDAERHD